MAQNELNGDALKRLSGVSGPTTTRFLAGRIDEPKSETVRRWARVFNVTEAQLRGLEPIPGITVENPGEPPIKLMNILTREELTTLAHMRSLDKPTRQAWLEIGRQLCANEQAKEEIASKHASVTRNAGSTGVRYRNPNRKDGGGHLNARREA